MNTNEFILKPIHQEMLQIMKQAFLNNKNIYFDDLFSSMFNTKKYNQLEITTAINELEENGYYLCETPTGKIQAGHKIELTENGRRKVGLIK